MYNTGNKQKLGQFYWDTAPQPWKLKNRKKTHGSFIYGFWMRTFQTVFSILVGCINNDNPHESYRFGLTMTFLHKEEQVCRYILKCIKETNKTVHRLNNISNFTHNRQLHNVERLQNLQ